MTLAFWIITAVSVPGAFLLPGMAKWIAIGWLGVIGALVVFSNWIILVRTAFGRRSSLIPMLRGPLLAVAFSALAAQGRGRLMIWGCLLDPWLALIAFWPVAALGRRAKGAVGIDDGRN